MTQISVTSFSHITPLWTFGGATCILRLYYTKRFVDSGNNIVLKGSLQNPYQSISCSIASGVITIPPITLTSTEDGTPTNATLTGVFFDSTGIQRTTFFSKYRIPVTTPTTWSAIFIHNQDSIVLPDEYYNKVQTDLLIVDSINAATKTIITLFRNYSNSLATAITAIGGTATTLIIDQDTTVSTAVVLPANIVLDIRNNAVITKSGSGTLEFQGIGILDADSQTPVFSGFSAGNITWTGTAYPSLVTTSLWANTLLSDKLKNAIGAFTDKYVTIKAYPGELSGTFFTVTKKKKIWCTAGIYTNTMNDPSVPLIRWQDNTELYGDGMGQTFISESSVAGNVRFLYASGVSVNPFDGYNENINFHDFTILGSATQTYDSGASSIELGNVKNGHAYRVGLENTHGFAIYFGLFGLSGYTANGWSITDCLIRGIGTQCIGSISGKNGLIANNKILDIQPDPTAPFAAVIDIEPNVVDDSQQNIRIVNNIIDGRNAQQSWSGIILQAGDVGNASGNVVADNTIIGCEAKIWYFEPSDITTATDRINLPNHQFINGTRTYLQAISGSLPAAMVEGFVWITVIDNDTVKISTSYVNWLAGTFVDLQAQGTGRYKFTGVGFLVNGVNLDGQNYSSVYGNKVIGATQQAYYFTNSNDLNFYKNEAYQCGGGGVKAGRIEGLSNSSIDNNKFRLSNTGLSESDEFEELEMAQTVNTATTGKLVSVTAGTNFRVQPHWIGKTVTINAVDYVVDRYVSTIAFTVTTDPGNQTGVALTTKFLSNTYKDNEFGGLTLQAGSRRLGDYQRVVSDSYAPAQITSNQNNYNAGRSAYRLDSSTDASRNITGLVFTLAQVDGEKHFVYNAGSFDAVIKNQDAASTAANRFKNSTGADITLTPGQGADIEYIGGSVLRWAVFKRN